LDRLPGRKKIELDAILGVRQLIPLPGDVDDDRVLLATFTSGAVVAVARAVILATTAVLAAVPATAREVASTAGADAACALAAVCTGTESRRKQDWVAFSGTAREPADRLAIAVARAWAAIPVT